VAKILQMREGERGSGGGQGGRERERGAKERERAGAKSSITLSPASALPDRRPLQR